MGVNDRVSNRLRNFCEGESEGATGTIGRFRSVRYVVNEFVSDRPLDVVGRNPGDCGIGLGDVASRALTDDVRSRGDGEGCRDARSRSLNRLFRNNASN